MNPEVDFYFNKATQWQKEIILLRKLVLGCGLTEELKWGCPCYTFQQSNVVLIHVFKNYCALLLFKGVLLQDEAQILIQQTENVQATRQIRFTSLEEIKDKEAVVKAYIFEAIEIERKGLKAPLKPTEAFKVPEEFEQALQKAPQLKTAFEALTPGR